MAKDRRTALESVQLLELQPSMVGGFEKFTYSHLRTRLVTMTDGDVAIGALDSGRPVGLIYAQVNANLAQVVSIFVIPSHRGLGVGTALLAAMEERMRAGSPRIYLAYPVGSSVLALERILAKRHFSEPVVDTLIYRLDSNLRKAPWFARYRLAQNARIGRWIDLSSDQRRMLASAQDAWYPSYLSPFRDEERVDPSLSVVLFEDHQPLGWCMAHRIADDTRLYSSLVVHPSIQHLGYAFTLVAESVNRQVSQNIPYGLFAVLVSNLPMLGIVQKWIQPYALAVTEQRSAFKVLSTASKR